MAKGNFSVLPEEFVKIWQQGKRIDAIAKKIGVSKQAVSTRAANYRKRYKIDLKKFNTWSGSINVPFLRSLAKKYAPKE